MRRRYGVWLMAGLFLLALAYLMGMQQPSYAAMATVTPTCYVYLAMMVHQPAPTPVPDLRITYVEYNPPGDDVEGEYVRIQNFGGGTPGMAGWTLHDESAHIFTFPDIVFPGSGELRVWTKVGVDTATDLYWGSAAPIWTNTGDTATLANALGTPVSVYSYP